MRSLRPGVRRSRSDQPHRRSGRSRVTFYHPTRAFALHVEPKRNRRRSKIALRCRRTGRGSEQRCQNLSASGGCSRAQVHWRTQDDGLDRHASIRVSGPKKDGKTTSAFEALNSEKENIMSIIRHEIRQISDENRGQPIISQAVVHGNIAYFAGITPNPIVGDIKTQTAQVLRRVDELLNLAGTDKSHLLSAQVWIADIRLFEDHNSVWNEWVDPANPPARACLTTDFWRPGMLVEVMVVAAVP